MSGSVRVTPADLQGYGQLLDRNAEYFDRIENFSHQTASDTSGFTGVMAALRPAVEGVTALYAETLKLARSRLKQVREELDTTAEEYTERERQIERLLTKIESELDTMRA